MAGYRIDVYLMRESQVSRLVISSKSFVFLLVKKEVLCGHWYNVVMSKEEIDIEVLLMIMIGFVLNSHLVDWKQFRVGLT